MRLYIISTTGRHQNNDYQIVCHVRNKRKILAELRQPYNDPIVLFRIDFNTIGTKKNILSSLGLENDLGTRWIHMPLDELITLVKYHVELESIANIFGALSLQQSIPDRKRKSRDDKELFVDLFDRMDISKKKKYSIMDIDYDGDVDDDVQ